MEYVTKSANIPTDKRTMMLQPYQFIGNHAVINQVPDGHTHSPLQVMVAGVDKHVRSFLKNHHDIDVLGQFYGEFLRYSGGDKQGLGIVLTPKHVCDLFARLANVKPEDTVLDICAGTGGFLIAAMAEMDCKAGSNEELRKRIRAHGLVGVEQRPDMFSLAAANMMLRGDGKANLHQGSCFDPAIRRSITEPESDRHERPNIGMINPPYSQKGEGLDELSFVKCMLDCLVRDGTGIAIVPISCAIQPSPAKESILEKHTLVAVMSMPDELLIPSGSSPASWAFRLIISTPRRNLRLGLATGRMTASSRPRRTVALTSTTGGRTFVMSGSRPTTILTHPRGIRSPGRSRRLTNGARKRTWRLTTRHCLPLTSRMWCAATRSTALTRISALQLP